MTSRLLVFLSVGAAAVAAGCGSSKNGDGTCDLATRSGCSSGQVCEATTGTAAGKCFEPVRIQGTVSDLSTGAMLGDARVVALDPSRAPLSAVAASSTVDPGVGTYSLVVRADRDATGKPLPFTATLRADAQGYQTFPGGIRTALPIDLSTAVHDDADHVWTISSALTTVRLLPLAGGGTAYIRGAVALPPSSGGTLVVAEPAAAPGTGGRAAVADEAGSFTVFNLTAGDQYVVAAYARGASYAPWATAALDAGENLVGPIALTSAPTAAFGGDLILLNGATDPISVALVVKSTYDAELDRGEVPPGLTVKSASGAYAFAGVPDGGYIVLAAYDADGNVRDLACSSPPCTNNTQPVEIAVAGGSTGVPGGFKITRAITGLAIDGQPATTVPPTVATDAPTFTWARASAYSSAQCYRVTVFDSSGTMVGTPHDQAPALGSTPNEFAMASGQLQHGEYYQLRIQAFADTCGSPALGDPAQRDQLSQTEDVLGVFTY